MPRDSYEKFEFAGSTQPVQYETVQVPPWVYDDFSLHCFTVHMHQFSLSLSLVKFSRSCGLWLLSVVFHLPVVCSALQSLVVSLLSSSSQVGF